MKLNRSWWVLLLAGLSWQCNAGSDADTDRSVWPDCFTNLDCGADGVCINHACPPACATTAQCKLGVCGLAPNGLHRCVPECSDRNVWSDSTDLTQRYTCLDGVSTACSLLDGTHCEVCGCGPGLQCNPRVGCEPKHAVGEPCIADSDCKSDNCSPVARVCRVPVGHPCDETNCDRCFSTASANFQYCSRECSGDFECNGGACVGSACSPRCGGFRDAFCPGSCHSFMDDLDNTQYYCTCDTAQPCEIVADFCREDHECVSNKCVSNSCAWPSSVLNGGTCTSRSECQSANCRSGRCRGNALLGDSCSSSVDCSVGTCCTQGAANGVCGLKCS